jgi:hypothetical protein
MSMLPWLGFLALVLSLLALDLGVFNRRPHVVSTREALGWTMFWVVLSLVFNVLVYIMYERHWLGIGVTVGHSLDGRQAAIEFFTAYLVEKSLSLDNIFVIALIFSYFQVPAQYQHRVLFWGVLGALVLRGLMIGAGLAFIQRFSWVVYVFGGLLIVTAIKMLRAGDEKIEPDKNPIVRLMRRIYPIVTVFRPGGGAREVSLPQVQPGVHPGLRRREDDSHSPLSDSSAVLPGRDRDPLAGGRRRIVDVVEARRCTAGFHERSSQGVSREQASWVAGTGQDP